MVKAIKTLKLSRHLNKVFIMPNNLGLYFIGLWATCFLLSVGYASNLLLFMAILQFALFFWWMITAHADTKQLQIYSIKLNSIHAGSAATLAIEWNDREIIENLQKLTLIDNHQINYTVNLQNEYQLHFEKTWKIYLLKNHVWFKYWILVI